MANIHLDKNNANGKWIVAAVVVVGVVGGAMWWSRSHDEDDSGRVTGVQPVGAQASSGMAADVPSAPQNAAEIEAKTKVMMALQQEAAKEIEKQPAVKPVQGNVTERPPYVSELEWMMLKGAAQQSPHPEQELTRLVNFLRFNKQQELWESLAQSPDTEKRRTLANQLLDELPTRVSNGDMDVKEAQRIEAGLLKDAVSDDAARSRREAELNKKLVAAASAASQAK